MSTEELDRKIAEARAAIIKLGSYGPTYPGARAITNLRDRLEQLEAQRALHL